MLLFLLATLYGFVESILLSDVEVGRISRLVNAKRQYPAEPHTLSFSCEHVRGRWLRLSISLCLLQCNIPLSNFQKGSLFHCPVSISQYFSRGTSRCGSCRALGNAKKLYELTFLVFSCECLRCCAARVADGRSAGHSCDRAARLATLLARELLL